MKHFDLDWPAFLDVLAAWHTLPAEARRIALTQLLPSAVVQPGVLGAQLGPLREAGFVENMPNGPRLRVPEARRPAMLALRAMGRHPLFDAPTPQSLAGYLDEHFSADEVQQLGGLAGFGATGRAWLAGLAGSVDWIDGFLACASTRQTAAWAGARRRAVPGGLAMPEHVPAIQALVRRLATHPLGVPLATIVAEQHGRGRQVLGAALPSALRYLLVYVALRPADLEPMIGVWPLIAMHRTRTPAPPPTAVVPVEQLGVPFLVEDMTTVLAAATADPLRLRGQDGAIFARTQQEIHERLVELPPWLVESLRIDPDGRVPFAADVLARLGYLGMQGAAGTSLRLAATAAGARWLAQPDHDRLAAVLDRVRKSKQRNPPSWYDAAEELGFFPIAISFQLDASRLDLREAVTRALLALPPNAFVPLADFLRFQQEVANPLLGMASAPGRGRASYGQPPAGREEWERLWGEILTLLLAVRLVPLGAVAVGRLSDGRSAITLTEVGRYLLGAAKSFVLAAAADDTPVVVQPNFDVVFLAPAPRVEAQLARVAERAGRAPGIAFRLTRASVLATAGSGMSLDELLELLGRSSSKPLPPNVARQLRDWYGAVRRVTLRPALLVDCADAETALRVQSALGKSARRLSDTVIETTATQARERAALVKRLRVAGVFVDG